MADDSGGASNKIVFTVDLDTKAFELNLNGVKQNLADLGKSGEGGFSELEAGIVTANEGLELLNKGMELFGKAMESIAKSDAMKNQEASFKSMASSIGVDSGQMLTALKQATHGTISDLDLMNTSFRMMNAGIKADQIPTLMSYADTLSKASGGFHSFNDILSAVTISVQRGTVTKGLADIGVTAGATGDRTVVLNSIMKQMDAQVQHSGETFHDFGEKLAASSKNTWGAVTKNVGSALSDFLAPILGDKTDQAKVNLDNLTEKLKVYQDRVKEGSTSTFALAEANGKLVTAQQGVEILTQKISEQKKDLTTLTNEETKATRESAAALGDKGRMDLELTAAEKQRAVLAAEVGGLEKRAADEMKQNGVVEIKTYQDLEKAKAAQINSQYDLQRENVMEEKQSATQLSAQLIEIERKRYNDIRALSVSAEQAKKAQDAAELSYLDHNYTTVLNFETRYIAAKNADEDKAYKQNLERLRHEGLSHEEYLKQLEQAEKQHEINIQKTKDEFSAVNERNASIGFKKALDGMKENATDFAKITENITKQSSGLLVSMFQNVAKGQGDAMQQMLSQFLEMIGQQMIQTGVYDLLAGWDDPVQAGAGAGLIAAGMALTSVGAANAPSSSGGGGSSGAGGSSSTDNYQPSAPQSLGQTSSSGGGKATIVVNGNIMNSKDTADYLQELIRNNSDITDYNIVAVGGKPYT